MNFDFIIYDHLKQHYDHTANIPGGVWRKRPTHNLFPYLHLGPTKCTKYNLNTMALAELSACLHLYVKCDDRNAVMILEEVIKNIVDFLGNGRNTYNFAATSIESLPIEDGSIWQYSTTLTITIEDHVAIT